MEYVLNIGNHNKNGQFQSNSWRRFIELINKNVDSLILYSILSKKDISLLFSGNFKIIDTDFIDLDIEYNAYKISNLDGNFWNSFKNANFDPDNGLTHIYFYKNKKCLANLNVDDEYNFVIINSMLYLKTMRENTKLIQSNSNDFITCKYFIDDLVEEDEWCGIEFI